MQAADVADQISEAMEEQRETQRATERFRTRAAIIIAALAMLLAIASLGGDNATKEAINSNILASDAWAFFQAKNIRQTDFRLAADEIELLLPMLPAEQQAEARRRVEGYRSTVARYESEPVPEGKYLKGTGKKELTEHAREYEEKRDHALKQDPNFDYATALLQIAIVLGSVSIVASSLPILLLSVSAGVIATVLMLNGFFLFFDLPIG